MLNGLLHKRRLFNRSVELLQHFTFIVGESTMKNVRALSAFILIATVVLNSFPAVAKGAKTFSHIEEKANKNGLPAVSSPNDYDTTQSELRAVIERYTSDRGSLNRFYTVQNSEARRAKMKKFYADWLAEIGRANFDAMSQDGKVDYVLFKNHLDHELRQVDIRVKQFAEIEALIPFASTLMALEDARRKMETLNSQKTAALFTTLTKEIAEKRKALEVSIKADKENINVKKTVANRAAVSLTSLRATMKNWFTFHNGYDPMFTWWVGEPYKQLDKAMEEYAGFLREKIVGVKPDDKEAIIGDPIGRETLMSELEFEMIPYTPEELISIAKKELDWCENEMKKASRELGYGDDWHKALEYVKTLYVEPGKQPELIKQLALEAIEFVEKNDLVTVPPLAKETWRMEMMTPERQLTSPFFLGGEMIQVSYPTNGMTHEAKMMSMRGNNIHFSRATVHHELIPGHHLQGFMRDRYKPYRGIFGTPFWGEGWALYWELILWEMNFPKTAENKIGMLFWRMHRCARIIFSLSFHLEKMSPQECIDLLVNRVGHELDNATAEVRRSFAGDYGPLYQAAYLLGGMQIKSLRKELVESKKMTNRQFHDAILKNNSMPIEMVRATLMNVKLTREYKPNWKFYGVIQ
jgi:uncharacterized protein (DUF885 family)